MLCFRCLCRSCEPGLIELGRGCYRKSRTVQWSVCTTNKDTGTIYIRHAHIIVISDNITTFCGSMVINCGSFNIRTQEDYQLSLPFSINNIDLLISFSSNGRLFNEFHISFI